MTSKKLIIAGLMLAVSGAVMAKLPPPSPEVKAKAAETAARLAWAAKVDGYQLCESQDRVASVYRARLASEGKSAAAAPALPACSDPGPFKYVAAPEERPREAAGAHSPSAPAASPHNTREPDAATKTTGDEKTPVQSNGPATVTEPAKTPAPTPTNKPTNK